MYEMQIMLETGEWMTVMMPKSPGINHTPYRYGDKRDAESQLKRLYPDTPVECMRIVRSSKKG